MAAEEKLRIDKYLWAIRIFKTRAEASEACEKGKVRSQGNTVKASKQVLIGNDYEIRAEARKWVIKVIGLISNRVQYSEATKYYIDNTPNDEDRELKYQGSSFNTGKRNSKIGRPTKKERRDIDDMLS